MTEFADAAPVAAEPAGVPVEAPVSPPAPIESRGPEAAVEPPKPEPKRSLAESIRKADADIKAKAGEPKAPEVKPEAKAEPKDPKVEAKTEEKPAQPRDQGRFASHEPPADTTAVAKAPHDEVPSRFTNKQAQADWANTSEAVRREIHRTLSDQDKGIQQYQETAKKFDAVKDFYEAAEAQGVEPRRVIERYVDFDRHLQEDFLSGLEKICRNVKGVSLQSVARHILGIPQDPAVVQHEARQIQSEQHTSQLTTELQDIKRQLQEQRQQQEYAAVMNSVSEFSNSHPRMEGLAEEIAREISLGFDLTTAYERADRLNPVPADALNHARTDRLKPVSADRSISGAPSAGSDPGLKPRSKSIREALDRAARQASA